MYRIRQGRFRRQASDNIGWCNAWRFNIWFFSQRLRQTKRLSVH